MNQNKKHQWIEETYEGYQILICKHCDILVAAVHDQPDYKEGKAYYYKEYNLIIIGAKRITHEQAQKACDMFGVDCR